MKGSLDALSIETIEKYNVNNIVAYPCIFKLTIFLVLGILLRHVEMAFTTSTNIIKSQNVPKHNHANNDTIYGSLKYTILVRSDDCPNKKQGWLLTFGSSSR